VEGTVHGLKEKKSAGKDHWHPVAFWSRSMSLAEQNYAVGHQDMLTNIMFYRY
jgi:hypothetical protein